MSTVLLFPIKVRDPKWDVCSLCGARSDYIGAIKVSDEQPEIRSPLCKECTKDDRWFDHVEVVLKS